MNRLSPIQTHFHISSLNLPTRAPLPPFAARFPFSARGEGRFISEDETFNLKFPRRGDILNRFPSLSLENFINRNEMRGGGRGEGGGRSQICWMDGNLFGQFEWEINNGFTGPPKAVWHRMLLRVQAQVPTGSSEVRERLSRSPRRNGCRRRRRRWTRSSTLWKRTLKRCWSVIKSCPSSMIEQVGSICYSPFVIYDYFSLKLVKY